MKQNKCVAVQIWNKQDEMNWSYAYVPVFLNPIESN